MRKYYDKLKDIKDFLYEIEVKNLDYNYAYNYFKENEVESGGACSSVRVGNIYGRNYDWTYNDDATFIVRTPHTKEHYAVIGVTGSISGFTDEFVKSREQIEEYKIVPFRIVDGVNEKGLFCNVNVVHLEDKERPTHTEPTVSLEQEVCGDMLVRYILDKFDNATTAVNYIKEHISIYLSQSKIDAGFDCHWMIGDKHNTYVLEIVDDSVVIIEQNIMTNFYINGVTFNEDGTVYTQYTQDSEHNAITTNNVQAYGSGLERYNLIVNSIKESFTRQDMRALLDDLKYSRTYTSVKDANFWYSEYTNEPSEELSLDIKVDTEYNNSILNNYLNVVLSGYPSRERGDSYWQTTHSSVYDLDKKVLYLVSQEDGEEIAFSLYRSEMTPMFESYDNLPTDYIPNNRTSQIHIEKGDEFIIGGSCSFSFRFNSISEDDIDDINFIYKSGVETYLVKKMNELTITPSNCGGIIVTSSLHPDETLNAKPIRDMFIQVRFVLKNGEIVYSNKAQLDVISTLDPTYIPPNN